MEPTSSQAMAPTEKKSGGKKFLIGGGIVLTLLAGAYGALCAYALSSQQIWRNTVVLGQEVGGLTVEEAAQRIEAALPEMEVGVYLYDGSLEAVPEGEESPEATVAVADLGADLNAAEIAQAAYDYHRDEGSFFTAGWRYLSGRGVVYGSGGQIAVDGEKAAAAAQALAEKLSEEAEDTSYEVTEDSLSIRMARDGRRVSEADLQKALEAPYWDLNLSINIPYSVERAQSFTAEEIHRAVSGEVKNAGYDQETQSITPEQVGAEFDVAAAQAAMDRTEPGGTVTVPAEVELPAVTAEELEKVLFRDLLGECSTPVGGTAARVSNVKLSAAACNGTVLNAGDVFSYNETTGQRTAAKGYKAAPAYVKGETVDEIGGGVCQTSSTLYFACLRSNLEITERHAHRYISSYITRGMDATVSWGGPDYKFTNNTQYPIKVVAFYKKGYLTMQLWGTKTDDVTVKMTYETVSSTPFQVIEEEDPAMAPGTQKVKTTPYTGYRVKTYRNLYDGDGKLISSTFEATSDYKSRDKVVLVGPPVAPSGGDAQIPVDPVNPTDPIAPADPFGPTAPPEPAGPVAPGEAGGEVGPPPIVIGTPPEELQGLAG